MNSLKVFWYISLALFMGILLWSYLYLPLQVSLDVGGSDLNLSLLRSHFFYLELGIFILVNASFSAWAGLIRHVSPSSIRLPRRDFWLANPERLEQFYVRFKLWLKGLNALVNIFLIFLLLTVYMANDNFLNFNTSPVLFFLLLLVFAWIAGYYFMFNSPDEDED